MMASPFSFRRRKRENSAFVSCSPTTAEGSSRISTWGFTERALAISTICWSAAGMSLTEVSGIDLEVQLGDGSPARRCSSLLQSTSRRKRRRGWRPAKMFSPTDRLGTRLRSW